MLLLSKNIGVIIGFSLSGKLVIAMVLLLQIILIYEI